MPTMKMPLAEAMHDDDELIIAQGGRKRRLARSGLMGSIEKRMTEVENAPSNSNLAQRLGSIEQWRANKADAIGSVSTTNIGLNILGNSVPREAKVVEIIGTVNSILLALRQREIISA